jgi:multiple sugar transport system substrate-binding protein
MRLTRRAALLGALAAPITVVPAIRVAAHYSSQAVTELSFWGGWTGPDGLAMQRLVSRFNAEVRDVRVTLTLYNWDLIFDRWRQEFDGGSPPDIVGIHATEIAEYAHRGMLRDVTVDARNHHLAENEFLPQLWRRCQVEGGLYAIPLDIHPLGLYINARAARRAGLDPTRPPVTATELLSWAARLTNRARGAWGYAAPAGDVECFRQWYSLLYQFGGRFLNAAGTRCTANSDAGARAYTFLRDTVTRHKVSMPEESSADADFLAEKVVMYVQGPWYIRGVQQAGIELVTAPMPRIGAIPLVWANSHVLGVVNTQDSARAVAAMRFIAWIHAHGLDWAEAGQVPAGNAARAMLPSTGIWPYLRPFAQQVPHLVYQPSLLVDTQLFAEHSPTPLINATRAVMLGQEAPAQAVRVMSEQVNQIISTPGAIN